MKNKPLKKMTYTMMATTLSISPFLPLTEAYANQSVEVETLQETRGVNEEGATLHSLEETKTSREENQKNNAIFQLSDWAYEENARYLILTAARNDKTSLYIPGEYNGKQVILQDLKIFPETMLHLKIEEVNGKKVGLRTSNLSESFTDSKVKSLDLSGLDTSKVTNMESVFYWASELESLRLDGWDTSNVTNMNAMFKNAEKLKALDLTSFDTSNVTTMSEMFAGLSEMTTLDLSSFKTTKVTDMSKMFSGAISLQSIILTSFDTSAVETMEGMFERVESLRTLDLRHFNTSKVVNMAAMFSGMKALESLNIRTFDTSNVQTMNSMFNEVESLTTLELNHFDTRQVEDMGSMFAGMIRLKVLDTTSFDTTKVTNMSGMFSHNNLSYLDLSHFNTISVKDMSSMFAGAENLISLDLGYFDTLNVENISSMFAEMPKLKVLDLMSFDLQKVEYADWVFNLYEEKSDSLVIFAKDPLIQSYDFAEDQRRASVLSYSMPTGSSTVISGSGQPGTEIKLSQGDDVLSQTVIGSSGSYELVFPKQPVGSVLTMEVTTPQYEIVTKKLVVRNEFKNFSLKTVPLPTTTAIYGTGEPGAKVEVYLSNGEVLDHTTVNSQGNFKLVIPQQPVNTVLTFKQSKLNCVPLIHKVAVYDELTVFETPQITVSSTALYGKGVPGAKVGIYLENGSRLAITTVNSKGNYKLEIPKQKAGTVLTIKQAKTGYGTLSKKLTVMNEFKNFTIKPASTSSVAVYGTGEPGAQVQAFVNGKAIGSLTKVNSKGNYKLVIPKQKAGTTVQIKMTKSGYQPITSKTTILNEIKTFTSNTPSASSTTISGKGVPGAKVGVYTSKGNRLAITTVNSNGNYKLTIPKQKAGTVLTLKQAKSGYLTVAKELTVLKEFKTFTVKKVSASSVAVYGTGEPGAQVRAFVNGKAISSLTKVNSKGNYKIVIPKQKAGTVVEVKMAKSGYQTISQKVKVVK